MLPAARAWMFEVSMAAALMTAAATATPAGAQQHSPGVLVPNGATLDEIATLAGTVTPSARQHRWLSLEFTAFVHFGMNTFTDREWGDGKETPDTFDPQDFDARQWARAFRDAGMRGIVLTCKHHDGFCLWPTATTEHSVKHSRWRGGKGDVVRAVADACREYGLEFGIYLSPWDRNHPQFGTAEYNDVFRAQLRELLTDYGPLYDVWFDGAHAPKDDPKLFDWVGHYALIRELQPGACISVMGPDVRWCGNEAGHTRDSEWNVIPLATTDDRDASASWDVTGAYFAVPVTDADLGGDERLVSARRLAWWPAMTNTSIRPGWFWHASQDAHVKSLDQLIDVWYRSVGGGTQFLLNVPPDSRGLVHEDDVRRLHEVGSVLRATFDTAVSDGARLVDARGRRELWFDAPRTVDVAVLAEDVKNLGQRAATFRLESFDGTDWSTFFRGTTIGQKRVVRFEPVTASAFRVVIEKGRGEAGLTTFTLHRRPQVLDAPAIARSPDGVVTIAHEAGTVTRYTTDGTEPGPESTVYDSPFAMPRGGMVRARSYATDARATLDLGLRTDAIAEFGLAPAGWTIHSVDSEQAPDEAAALAIDGDPNTLWHSRWKPDVPAHPHHIVIDLGRSEPVTGFSYLPRQDGGSNGSIARYGFRVSTDGIAWKTVVANGEFANIENNPVQQIVRFGQSVDARYVELISHGAVGDRPWASAAELGVLVD